MWWVAQNSTDIKAISAQLSWSLAGWLGLSLAILMPVYFIPGSILYSCIHDYPVYFLVFLGDYHGEDNLKVGMIRLPLSLSPSQELAYIYGDEGFTIDG